MSKEYNDIPAEKTLGERKPGTFDYKMEFAKIQQSWKTDPGNISSSSQRGSSSSNVGMLSPLPPPSPPPPPPPAAAAVARGAPSSDTSPMGSTTTMTSSTRARPRRSFAYNSLIDRLKDRLKEETIATIDSIGKDTIGTDTYDTVDTFNDEEEEVRLAADTFHDETEDYDEDDVPIYEKVDPYFYYQEEEEEDVPFDEQQSTSGPLHKLLARVVRSSRNQRVVAGDDPPGFVVDVVEDGYDDNDEYVRGNNNNNHKNNNKRRLNDRQVSQGGSNVNRRIGNGRGETRQQQRHQEQERFGGSNYQFSTIDQQNKANHTAEGIGKISSPLLPPPPPPPTRTTSKSTNEGNNVHSSLSLSSKKVPGDGVGSIPLTVDVAKEKSSVEKESSSGVSVSSTVPVDDSFGDMWSMSKEKEKEKEKSGHQAPATTTPTAMTNHSMTNFSRRRSTTTPTAMTNHSMTNFSRRRSSTTPTAMTNLSMTNFSKRRSTMNRRRSSYYGFGYGDLSVSIVDEDMDNVIFHETYVNFLDDDPKTMTNSRQLALWLMKRFAWYNPRLNSTRRYQPDVVKDGGRFRSDDGYPRSHRVKETPSLEKAWAYFEHVTLTRHYSIEEEGGKRAEEKSRLERIKEALTFNHQLDRAEPGECKLNTTLYHPFLTPYSQLGDFGLGIGLYFATIRGLTLLILVAGIIHIPNVMYYAGPKYSGGQTDVATLRRGSAICTNSTWVVCPTCNLGTPGEDGVLRDGDFPLENEGYSFLHSKEHNITLFRKNLCEGPTLGLGFVNLGCFIFICIGSIFLALYLKSMEKEFDEDEQTTRDYSIRIDNPPEDARDPLEWKEFFRDQFGAHVTGCTISLSNDRLVRALKERREKMRKLEADVKSGTSLDMVTLAAIAVDKDRERNFVMKMLSCVLPGFPEHFARVAFLTSIIQGLAQQEYPVTNVFITFETEKSQQEVLQTLTVSRYQVKKQKPTAVPHTRFLFRGHHLLSIKEPEEPDAIHWDHLNTSWADLFKQQLYTALATCSALLVVVFLVVAVNTWSTIAAAYTIALTNVAFPFSAKALTKFEAHPTAASFQTSMYFKIALFRWVNTAIVITMITPFVDTLRNGDQGLITQIQAQFMAEITTVALIQIADPVGQLRRHFLAPRAKTQDEMNIQFQGTEIHLAERYTSISKIIFLTLWYCSIYPASLYVCAFALQVINWMDRFSLMRTWKRSPRLGSRISRFNRAYFLPLSIVAMAVFSSYFWSGFPYDNLCENEGSRVTDDMAGNYTIPVHDKSFNILALYYGETNETTTSEVKNVTATIEAGASTYRFCNQDFLGRGERVSGAYPFVPLFQPDGDEWMTEDQITVCTYYGWVSFFFAFGWLVIIFFRGLRNMVFGYFIASWKPTGEDQNQNYSELDTVNLYVPEVKSPVISYPLLAVCVDKIDPVYMEWFDPEHPHAYYDLTKDAEVLVKHRGRPMVHNQVFSTVTHFPPHEEESQFFSEASESHAEGSSRTASGITEEFSGQKAPFMAKSA